MKKRMSVFMLMVALVTGACCNRHIEPEPIFTAEDFPLKVGNWWRYRVTDSLNNTVDTLFMRIDSMKIMNDEKHYFINTIQGSQIGGGTFIVFSDTLIIYEPSQNYNFPIFTLRFPFGVDSFYINRIYGKRDTLNILSYEKEYQLFGKKYPAFHITSSMWLINIAGRATNDMRISPKIGIISNDNYFDHQAGTQDIKLELIEYHIE
ncbi:MAG: hypothetical protein K1X92_05705 [Bacteroidia bacterium]|nr:hypothetical protein [Bacteroidia bacterium]